MQPRESSEVKPLDIYGTQLHQETPKWTVEEMVKRKSSGHKPDPTNEDLDQIINLFEKKLMASTSKSVRKGNTGGTSQKPPSDIGSAGSQNPGELPSRKTSPPLPESSKGKQPNDEMTFRLSTGMKREEKSMKDSHHAEEEEAIKYRKSMTEKKNLDVVLEIDQQAVKNELQSGKEESPPPSPKSPPEAPNLAPPRQSEPIAIKITLSPTSEDGVNRVSRTETLFASTVCPRPVTAVLTPPPSSQVTSATAFDRQASVGVMPSLPRADSKLSQVYEGDLIDDRRHGRGKLKMSNGDMYDGEFQNDYQHGYGILYFAQGGKYTGSWANGKYHGRGKHEFASGDTYDGHYADGEMQGEGKFIYANGDKYVGQMYQSKRHGKGTFTYQHGGSYQGDWVLDQRCGTGTNKYPNGNLYEGQFLRNRPHGHGRLTFANGDWYSGSFYDGTRQGQGVYQFKSGNRYEGEWKDNQKHGNGVFSFAAGGKFEGTFALGKRNGRGIFTDPEGKRWEEQWNNDQFESRKPLGE